MTTTARPVTARRRAVATAATLAIALIVVGAAVQQTLARASESGVTAAGATLTAADGVLARPAGVFDSTPAVARLDESLRAALESAAQEASADGVELRINSGWRSPAHQLALQHDAEQQHGSAQEAARWVASADDSRHVSGDAVDIGPWAAAEWLGAHGAAYGLCRVFDNEPWHFELQPQAPSAGCLPTYPDATQRKG